VSRSKALPPFVLRLHPDYTPTPPPYLRRIFTELHSFADGLEDESSRAWLDEADYKEISNILRRLAGNEEARRLLFSGKKRRPGKQSRRQDS
jgi:hypothetical protein